MITSRSQIWDGVDWVPMTSGVGAIDHVDLTNVLPDQHHTKYLDVEAISAVDNGTYLKLTGGVMTGNIDLNANSLVGVTGISGVSGNELSIGGGGIIAVRVLNNLNVNGAFLSNVADPGSGTDVGNRTYNDTRYNYNRYVVSPIASTTLTAGVGANQLVQSLTVPLPYLDAQWVVAASGYINASVGGTTVEFTATLRWSGSPSVTIQTLKINGTGTILVPFTFSNISEPPVSGSGGLELVIQRDDVSGTQIANSVTLTAHKVGI